MRVLILILIVSSAINVRSQSVRALYEDTVWMMPDSSMIHEIKSTLRATGASESEIQEKVITQIKNKCNVRERISIGNKDSTVITFVVLKSDIKTADKTRSILMKQNELYVDEGEGFTTPTTTIPKSFVATGEKRRIGILLCDEHISSDGTWKIYVSPNLPQFVNPGVRVGNIKGGIAAFEFRASPYRGKCVLVDLKLGE